MSIMDYDRIIQLIEENITAGKKDLISMVTSMLHLSQRDTNEILKFIDPEGRTLPAYIFERKLFRALEDFASGMSKDDIAEKYQYSDTSHFGGYVYNLCGGKTPLQHRKDGYICPAPLYLKDIIAYEINDKRSEIESVYKKELLDFVEEIVRLKDELSKEKKKGYLKTMENLSESEKAVPLLSADNYSEFLKVEDMRMLYGFDVKTMLNLYNTSVSSGSPLEDLCDKELEKIYYTDRGPSNFDDTESLAYHILYEGDSMQNWEYFAGDDEVDDRESMRDENLYSDVELLTSCNDICDENHEEYEEYDVEFDNEPSDEQLKEWFGIEVSKSDDTFA